MCRRWTLEPLGMELDYFNEAANAEEFALRHAFLPFVTSPGWIPELMGPKESSRVLALKLGTSWEGSRTVPGRFQEGSVGW